MKESEREKSQSQALPTPEQPRPEPAPPTPPPAPAGPGREPAANLPDLPCDACRDLIPLVQDGAASDASVQLVAQHIAHCKDCLAFWQAGAPAAAPDDGKVLSKIHRRLRLVLAAALAVGALLAFWLNSFAYHLELDLVVLPVVGAMGYLLLRRRWYFAPLAVAVLGYVWHVAVRDVSGPLWHALLTGPLGYAVIYGLLCLPGALAARLFAYAFGKEDSQ